MAILNSQMKIGQSGAPIFAPEHSLKSLSLQSFQDLSLQVTDLLQLLQVDAGNIFLRSSQNGYTQFGCVATTMTIWCDGQAPS